MLRALKHILSGPAVLRNLIETPAAQNHDLLIDTAHDKPQAPEGPTYHIENKGMLVVFLPMFASPALT